MSASAEQGSSLVADSSGTAATDTAGTQPPRLWVLRLVFGSRWLTGVTIAIGMLLAYWLAANYSETVIQPEGALAFFWSPVIFFCAITAYLIPVFHYITEQTEAAFDELLPHLSVPAEGLAAERIGIAHKPLRWVLINMALACAFWFLQQWLLIQDWDTLVRALTYSAASASFILGPLLVWLVTSCAVHALVNNALLFRRLARLVDVDLLDRSSVLPIGRMAVYSNLLVIGGMALMPIMAIGGQTAWWGYIPALIPMCSAAVVLFFAPQWPLHQRLREQKAAELEAANAEIQKHRDASHAELAGYLAYRREIRELSNWPIDIGGIGRLLGYIVIVPLTWIGAALIEMVVDSAIGG
ncbi:MAG: hypothetical protein AAF515_09655 [Pseudomonadota bacterium]